MVSINITVDGGTWEDCMKQLRGAINPDSHNHVVHCALAPEKPSKAVWDTADKPQSTPEASSQAETPASEKAAPEASESVQEKPAEEKKKRSRKPAQEKQAEPAPQVEEFVPDFPPSDDPFPEAEPKPEAAPEAAPAPTPEPAKSRIGRPVISKTAADWINNSPNNGVALRNLLKKYGVNALTKIPDEDLDDFAAALKQLGCPL